MICMSNIMDWRMFQTGNSIIPNSDSIIIHNTQQNHLLIKLSISFLTILLIEITRFLLILFLILNLKWADTGPFLKSNRECYFFLSNFENISINNQHFE
jgi:hypothetical protein